MTEHAVLRAFLHDRIEFTDCLELLAVLLGKKTLVRLTGCTDRLEDLGALMREINLAHTVAPLHLEARFDNALRDRFARLAPGFPGEGEEGILFAGSPDAIERAVEMELRGCPADEAALLYGYPQCCARNYEAHIQHSAYWVDAFLAGARGVVRVPWLMNRMGRLFAPYLAMLPDYFPCNIMCADSLHLAGEYASLLETAGLTPLKDLAKAHLARPILKHAGCLYRLHPLQEGAEDALITVQVADAIAYAGDRLPGDTLTLACRPGGLTIPEAAFHGKSDADAVLVLFE